MAKHKTLVQEAKVGLGLIEGRHQADTCPEERALLRVRRLTIRVEP